MSPTVQSVLCTAIFVFVLLAVGFERTNTDAWNSRLLFPNFEEEPDLHTPIYFEGVFFPPVITANRTLSAKDNPIILPSVVRIPKDITLSITEGARIYAHEYAQIRVEGSLIIAGTEKRNVVFTTNERHIQNRVWGGIIFLAGSFGQIEHANIRHASPALSCLEKSNVAVSGSTIELANLGVFAKSDHCSIAESIITAGDDGIVSIGPRPVLTNTIIRAKNENIRTY